MKTIFSIFALIVLLGCNKDQDKLTILEGNLSDYYSGSPIFHYKLHTARQKFSIYGSPIIILDTFWTDVSGNFSYSFYNETGYIYYLVAGHDNSYTRFDDYDVDYNKTNTFEIKVKPYRVIELELVNKTGRYREISIWQAEIYNIQFLDTTIFLDKIIPEEEYTLYIWLYENSEDIPIALEEHFTINNVDTTSFKLNY